MRDATRVLFYVVAVAAITSCAPGASGPSQTQQKLSAVAPLPKPSLPPWIDSISPTSTAQNLAQIRVIFTKPIAPLAALEGNGAQSVLSHFQLAPALKGRFVLLTPKMVGFVADEALPIATRVQVTLTAGLSDLQGDRLASDVAWTFETKALKFSDLPQATTPDQTPATPAPLAPTLTVTANAPVDTASLGAHTTLRGGGDTVDVTAALQPTPTPPPGAAPDATARFDRSQLTYTYELKPTSILKRGTSYALHIAPGVEPARGNVATTHGFTGAIRTFDPLVVQSTPTPSPTSIPYTRFSNGDPTIRFNNPIDKKTIAGNITISPQPSPAPRMILADSSDIAVDPYALEPDRHYTVTVGTGLKDRFGQSLSKPQTIEINTGNFAPGMWAPSGWNQIPAGAGVDINFYATNLPRNAYRAKFVPLSALSILTQSGADTALGDGSSWPSFTLSSAKANRQSIVRIDVQRRLGAPYGALAYGFASAIGSGVSTTGVVQLTNLGVFAQFFPAQANVMVQHLDDGSPAAGASITVYRTPDSTPQRCATATTKADGVARFSETALQSCYATASAGSMPTLGVVATQGGDVAGVMVYDWSGVPYTIPSAWASGAPSGTGTIFPDRDMYQPSERGDFTGIAYYVQGGVVHADTNDTMRLTLEDPDNNSTSLGTVRTDAYGTFSYPYTFGPAQKLGYYTIKATSNLGYKIYGNFRVAEFKPPNFKLDVALDKTAVAPGGSVAATGTAAYLFGAPLSGGKDRVYVTRDYAALAPKGWSDYAFGRQWFWPQQQPSITTDVLQQDLPFDSSGVAKLNVAVASDIPAPLQYTVEMQATDVSNLSVSSAKTFLALPGDGAIGLASNTVGAAKSAMPIRVIVTDADGRALSGRAVHLELQKMTYVSASQAQEGGQSADEAVKFTTVDRADVTSGSNAVTANLTPPEAGSYRVRANFAGVTNPASATDMQVFAFGQSAADFGAQDTTSVNVTLDKKTYKVGDTATAVIGSPFNHADVYVSVVRYGTIYSKVLHDVSGAPSVSFKITPAMFPNAAIEAVAVRRGAKLASVKPGSLDSLVRYGMAPFAIDVKDRYLKVAITPQQAKLAPGAMQHVSFTVKDAQGRPVRGKIVAMAVNDAVLQLSGYRLPDLVSTIFAQQPISTRYADSRTNITLRTPTAPVEKGFGYGGGFLAGAAGTRVRTNFQPLAYYGTLVTDAGGNGSVDFKLPDDLTTWRIMAVAIASDDRHFGTSDATFVAQLPLMANPLLPQFARPGDQVQMGLSVLAPNPSGNALDLALQLTGGLSFATGNPTQLQTKATVPSGIQAYRYPVNVGTPAPDTSFGARAAIGSAGDAFKLPFPIVDRATTETVVDAGASSGQISIPVDSKKGGSYRIVLANSVAPQLKTQGESILKTESIGTANSLASRLIVAAAVGDASAARANLGALLKLQRDDGGFGYCTFSKRSDPFASSYALRALAFARSHGVAIDANAITRVKNYAATQLANPQRDGDCKSALCQAETRFMMLQGLASAGDRRTSFLDQIYAQRDRFANATQIRLARYLLSAPGWQATGATYAATLKQTLYVTGRYSTANLNTPWGWLVGHVDAQAQMLQLLLETKAPAGQVDGAARSLLSQSCKCGWPTAEGTASAIVALDAYGAKLPPAAMSVEVSSNGTNITSASFDANPSSKTIELPASKVSGKTLSLRASGGTLHYVVTYTYPVAADSPGNVTAFHVIRALSDPGSPTALATMDLTAPAQVSVQAGRVFDVGVRIAVDHPVDRVVIDDPLPAGFEAIDQSFSTATQSVIPQSDNWEIGGRTVYRDRVMAYADHLDPGVYELHYLVRSVTPGTYRWPGTKVYLEDAPEQFGRTAAATLLLQ